MNGKAEPPPVGHVVLQGRSAVKQIVPAEIAVDEAYVAVSFLREVENVRSDEVAKGESPFPIMILPDCIPPGVPQPEPPPLGNNVVAPTKTGKIKAPTITELKILKKFFICDLIIIVCKKNFS